MHSNIMEEADVHNLVKSVANKQQANKRKRDPDMYLDAVLECTVRRLNRERMEREEVARKKRRLFKDEGDNDNSSPQQYENDLSRPFTADNINTIEENNCEQMDRQLDEQLSGDLKGLLDELAREFPGDFWLTDTNNNCSGPSQPDEPSDDLWLLSMVGVLCSS